MMRDAPVASARRVGRGAAGSPHPTVMFALISAKQCPGFAQLRTHQGKVLLPTELAHSFAQTCIFWDLLTPSARH